MPKKKTTKPTTQKKSSSSKTVAKPKTQPKPAAQPKPAKQSSMLHQEVHPVISMAVLGVFLAFAIWILLFLF